jgi:hypothetical protein
VRVLGRFVGLQEQSQEAAPGITVAWMRVLACGFGAVASGDADYVCGSLLFDAISGVLLAAIVN